MSRKSDIFLILLSIIIITQKTGSQSTKCTASRRHCYCDPLCTIYGDCCDKYIPSNNSFEEDNCKRVQYTVNRCPNNTVDPLLLESCQNETLNLKPDFIFHIPVYTDIIYKNAFCAICNEEKNYKFVDVECKISKDMKCNSHKHLLFKISRKGTRICYENKEDCQINFRDIKDLCISEPTFYNGDKREVKRNLFCFHCKRIIMPPLSNGRKVETSLLDFNSWCSKGCQKILANYQRKPDNISINSRKSLRNLKSPLLRTFYIITNLLSILTLSFLLIAYIFMKDLQNLAGRITFCLGSSILLLTLTNITFILVNKDSFAFCFMISLLLQYSYLSSFFWMTIFAVDVYRSVTSTKIKDNNEKSHINTTKLAVYSIVGYGTPSLFCVSVVFLKFFGEDNILNPKFGIPQCFINRLVGGLVWLFIPLSICLLVNVIICGFLYKFLYESRQNTNVAGTKLREKKFYGILCIKISILFGVTRLPEFVGIFTNINGLKIFGGILSSMHGVLLGVCFLSGAKVRRKTSRYLTSIGTIISNFGRISSSSNSAKKTQS